MCFSTSSFPVRKILSIVLLVLIPLVLSSSLVLAQADEVDIASAVTNNQIQADVEASGNSYYGPGTLMATLENSSSESLTVVVPQGLRFRSLDTTYQDEIVAVTERIPLQPGETATVPLTSFCGNAHRAAPVAGNKYVIGKMEPARMRNLLSEIEQQNLQDDIQGQWAVWGETDDLPTVPTPDFSDVIDLLDELSSQGVVREVAENAPALNGSLLRKLKNFALLKTLLPYVLAILGLLLLALLLWWLLHRRRPPQTISSPSKRSGSPQGSKKRKPKKNDNGSNILHGKPDRKPKS
jgi:type II secretory pathway pseudopilin PulG